MILLPHNCSCSEPSIHPPDWRTAKSCSLKKKWYVQYYFYDPEFKDDPKQYGKLIIVKAGVNRYKTLSERRSAVSALLDYEINQLKEGFNPITKRKIGDFDFEYEIDPSTPAEKAIKRADKNIKGAPSTISDITSVTKYLTKSLRQLRLSETPIQDLRRKHLRVVLEHMSEQNNYSDKRYNKVRSYVLMIFSELAEMETIEINPVKEIKKRKTVKRLRTILTADEREKINNYLKPNNYKFWRFLQLFFHAGCRTTEFLRIRKEDVRLFNLEFKILVKKGRGYEEVIKPINKNVVHLWSEILSDARDHEYLFSNGLVPGINKIREDQITRRWKRHVKGKLGITVDFYALKHLHTDLIAEAVDINMASAVNGHKSTHMAVEHYAVNHKKRLMESMKKINVQF
ncbi:MAG TPA: tyrosine-type recombinase/integrase [Salinimicrobium sp.]|nr:tyrosine-type recombinase/integrase [Salinimicrobium sp.]